MSLKATEELPHCSEEDKDTSEQIMYVNWSEHDGQNVRHDAKSGHLPGNRGGPEDQQCCDAMTDAESE